MSKSILKCLLIALVSSFFLTGCIFAPVVPPKGLLYTDQKAPLMPIPTPIVGDAEGTSSTHTILFLVAFGDGSIDAAAKNGGITTITHLDYEFENYLGIYQRYTTIAKGLKIPAGVAPDGK